VNDDTVAVYTRVSTVEQSEESQDVAIRNYLVTQPSGSTICWYSDHGISAYKDTYRPDYERLKADVARGIIKRVIVFKLDRLSRNVMGLIEFFSLCDRNKVQVHSLNDPEINGYLSDDMIRPVILVALGLAAQLESKSRSARASAGHAARRLRGVTTIKKKIPPEAIEALCSERDMMTHGALANRYGVSISTVRRYLAEHVGALAPTHGSSIRVRGYGA
jgi:DNA invertase Pin-like site-specific DNA recombinase